MRLLKPAPGHISTTFAEHAARAPGYAFCGTDVEAILEDTQLTLMWRNVEGNGQASFPVAALPMVLDFLTALIEQPHIVDALTPADPEQ